MSSLVTLWELVRKTFMALHKLIRTGKKLASSYKLIIQSRLGQKLASVKQALVLWRPAAAQLTLHFQYQPETQTLALLSIGIHLTCQNRSGLFNTYILMSTNSFFMFFFFFSRRICGTKLGGKWVIGYSNNEWELFVPFSSKPKR